MNLLRTAQWRLTIASCLLAVSFVHGLGVTGLILSFALVLLLCGVALWAQRGALIPLVVANIINAWHAFVCVNMLASIRSLAADQTPSGQAIQWHERLGVENFLAVTVLILFVLYLLTLLRHRRQVVMFARYKIWW